jgi:acetyl-CoA C-acetyltransferase
VTDHKALDPDTPVLVGVGQHIDRLDAPGYRALSAVDLAGQAAWAALVDTAAQPDLIATAIDTVAGVRQFEISTPDTEAPLGKSDNYPRSVADRCGADPARAILDVTGGQSPQHLVNERAAEIACGRSAVAMVFGAEALSTTRHFATAEERPDFAEVRGGQVEDRGFGLEGLVSRYGAMHGLVDAPSQYALFENARRARLGLERADYARSMGQLLAPFTAVAAANPYAAAPVVRDAEQLITVDERNRMIADPYTRLLVARDQVNQGAAVLLMSVRAATRLGVPQHKWVFLCGHADLREKDLLDREDLSTAPASVRAVKHALEIAGIGVAELSFLDLYSCFPIAVSNICDGLELSADDPRGLTVTGGMPFFGGPGNNYSMHAIAKIVARVRAAPGALGLVGANGGTLSKYSVGVYSTRPRPWRSNRSDEVQAELDAAPSVASAIQADGWATIETYTVKYRSNGATGIVVGRLDEDKRRFFATTMAGDSDMLDLLTHGEPIGQRVFVRSHSSGNRVSTTAARLAAFGANTPLASVQQRIDPVSAPT